MAAIMAAIGGKRDLYMQNRFTQLVELVVSPSMSTLTRIQFVDQPYLRGAFIKGIETFTVNDMALSPQQNAVISGDVLKKSYITFYTTYPSLSPGVSGPLGGPGEYIQQLPLSVLHLLQNSNNDPFERHPFELVNQTIIWEKSFIILGSGIGNTGANNSFLFNVSFELNPNNMTN